MNAASDLVICELRLEGELFELAIPAHLKIKCVRKILQKLGLDLTVRAVPNNQRRRL